MSNLSRQFRHLRLASSQRLTCPRQRPCGPEHQARYPASYTAHLPGGDPGPAALAFLLPFGRRHSLLGHPVPPGSSAPLTVGLPTGLRTTRACRADPGGVSTFRTRETRTGPGALYTPGTAVFAGHRSVRGRRLPPLSGRSLAPRHNDPTRDVISDEASARVP